MFEGFRTEWQANKSFVVFRDHPNLNGKPHALVERIQKSGLCYMNAGVVLQHYLVAMNSENQVPMLNLPEYLKKYMDGESLYNQIWNNQGGDSLTFLKNILKVRPEPRNIFHCSSREDFEAMDEHLRTFGPALVSGFQVSKDFLGPDWQHLGSYNVEKIEGKHAMVLVGYRVVNGKKRYLLQNWWKFKPYVEVDVEYLLSSKAIIHFITEPQMEMGDFPTNMEPLVYCESAWDAPENPIPQGEAV